MHEIRVILSVKTEGVMTMIRGPKFRGHICNRISQAMWSRQGDAGQSDPAELSERVDRRRSFPLELYTLKLGRILTMNRCCEN